MSDTPYFYSEEEEADWHDRQQIKRLQAAAAGWLDAVPRYRSEEIDPPGPSPAPPVQRPRVQVTLGNPTACPLPFHYYDPVAGLEIRAEIGEDGEVRGRAMWRKGES